MHVALLIVSIICFILAGVGPIARLDGNYGSIAWIGMAFFAASFLPFASR